MRARTLGAALWITFTPVWAGTQPGSAQTEASTQEDTVFGKRSSIAFPAPETALVVAGSRLHQEPGDDSPILAMVPADVELEVLARQGDWIEVRYHSRQGWTRLGGAEDSEREAQSLLDQRGWVLARTADGSITFAPAPIFSAAQTEARIRRVRELLGERERVLDLGPYKLYTDVENEALLESLAATASVLAEIYADRLGLALEETEQETIALFARESGYREYESGIPEIADLATLGHQSDGLAVTFVGDRRGHQVRRVLLHELTHLLNRRALPLVLPSWLEEGLAEDLSFSKVDERGRLLPGTVLGVSVRSTRYRRVSGGFASLSTLLRHWRKPTWPKVTSLVEAEWEQFVQPEARPAYYTQAAFFIRFLLDGNQGRHADGFRDFLRQVAEGNAADGSALWTSLGVPGVKVERDYDLWIWNQAQAHGVVTGER